MKKYYFFIYFLLFFYNCTDYQKNKISDFEKEKKENKIETEDSLFFDNKNKIIGIAHYENNIKNGFSLILNKQTQKPKFLVEYNKGKKDKVIIAFYNNGNIKSLRTSDIHNVSQKLKFHENGVIKSIGNTFYGKAFGNWYYFDEKGKLINKKVYKKGQVQK